MPLGTGVNGKTILDRTVFGGSVRTKSESRRDAILETAAQAFCERGFDATSMSEVAARVGGSKATLYNYFDSKEALFAAVMLAAVKEQAAPVIDAFCRAPTIEAAVRGVAPDYIRLKLNPDVLAVNRMCVSEGARCGFGPALYEQGAKPAWIQLSARIKAAMDVGELRQADPWRATLHLLALCEAGPVEATLRGWSGPPSETEIVEAAESAADVFLRAYKA
jgi:AcrR family transcriptional regulator